MGRVGLMAGMLALMLQVFAWALTMPAQSAVVDRVTICTADGLVYLDVDWPFTDTEQPAHDAAMMDGCPLCPLIGGLYLPPPPHLLLQHSCLRHGPEGLPVEPVIVAWFLSTLKARAPPVYS